MERDAVRGHGQWGQVASLGAIGAMTLGALASVPALFWLGVTWGSIWLVWATVR